MGTEGDPDRDGDRNNPDSIGMVMKRLPIIRHLRWVYHTWQVNKHYEFYRKLGMLPVNADKDYEVLDAIWRGEY
jgi:hypothetical protein